MAGVQGVMTLLLSVSMLWASLFVSESNGQTPDPCLIVCSVLPGTPRVCGSDGVTYANECELFVEKGCRKPNLVLAYSGPCTACETPCTADDRPVCGSDGNTYSNDCQLDNEHRCRNPDLYKWHDGPCTPTTTPCYIACPEYYSPVCGSDGTTYSNICFLNAARICGNPALYEVHDGPCDGCDKVCYKIYQPICGSDWVTYDNDCYFEIAQCKNPHLTKLHDGECRGGSGNCDKPCPKHHQPVCGTNWITYDNYCLFEIAHCKWKIGIKKFSACSSGIRTTSSTLIAMLTLLGSLISVLL